MQLPRQTLAWLDAWKSRNCLYREFNVKLFPLLLQPIPSFCWWFARSKKKIIVSHRFPCFFFLFTSCTYNSIKRPSFNPNLSKTFKFRAANILIQKNRKVFLLHCFSSFKRLFPTSTHYHPKSSKIRYLFYSFSSRTVKRSCLKQLKTMSCKLTRQSFTKRTKTRRVSLDLAFQL